MNKPKRSGIIEVALAVKARNVRDAVEWTFDIVVLDELMMVVDALLPVGELNAPCFYDVQGGDRNENWIRIVQRGRTVKTLKTLTFFFSQTPCSSS